MSKRNTVRKSIMRLAQEINPRSVKIEGAGKLEKGQIAVGVMSDDLKRLFYLDIIAVDKANGLLSKINHTIDTHEQLHTFGGVSPRDYDNYTIKLDRLLKEHTLAVAEHEAFTQIFWASARIEFPELLGKRNVGIAKNFTLFYVPEDLENTKGGRTNFRSLAEAVLQMMERGRRGF